MAWTTGTTLKNAQLDAIESTLGSSATLKVYTGTPPASCEAAVTGTLLATITIPADPFTAASGGSVTLQGTWTTTAVATGTAGYVRLATSGGTGVLQTAIGDGITIDNAAIVSGQAVTVTSGTFAGA